VSCRFHLGLEVGRGPGGSTEIVVRPVFRDRDVWEIRETCALDVADRGPQPLSTIARLFGGITRERARQIQQRAIERGGHADGSAPLHSDHER
jgi:hypothetical protein